MRLLRMYAGVAVVIILAVGCERRSGSKPAPLPPTVTAPEPPRPGHATLTFRGAFSKTVDSDGTYCADETLAVGAADLGDTRAPAWNFYLLEQQPGTWVANLAVGGHDGVDETNGSDDTGDTDDDDGYVKPDSYSWKGTATAPQLVRSPSSATIALTLVGPGGATVTVSGELRCSTFSTTPVPPAITALLARHASASVRPYSTYDFGRARYPGAASAIVLGGEVVAEAKLRALRPALPPGWVAYLGTTSFLGDDRQPDGAVELVVAPGASTLDILRNARTDAVNYDLGTEALIRKLAAWDRAWGIDIVHAETDTIELELRRLPDDLDAFAREVHAFCPDVVDQGTGTVAALRQEIAGRRRVFLWWD